ncbi:hypothetical protein QBC40DRAFT_64105 [Triangularia verruculosa]|uniref:Uncharacterized protein n=1 Tax=Triangularia verruculosa TaxID=2587418 RepID=A0AAN7AVV3_9PEZI|nr:hypothetical protein QBC40DRAFT_64105 [Triangularia verruculosa]
MSRKNRRDLDSWVPDWSSVYDEADRRRARAAYDNNTKLNSFWKLTVVRSEGEYWRYVVKGMVQLTRWLQRNPDKKLPSRLHPIILDYGDNLERCSRFYSDSSRTTLFDTVERIRKMCSKLATYCTNDENSSQVPWMHLFGLSAALYRRTRDELTLGFQNDGVEVDWLYRTQIADDDVSCPIENHFFKQLMAVCIRHKRDSDCVNAEHLSHRPFLSLESITRGTVKRVGTKLLSWGDRHSAFNTISRWVADYLPLVDGDKLRMANILVGDEKKYAHDDLLLEWFDGMLQGKSFHNDPRMKDLDEALVLTTEGRAIFLLDDGTLGLGPGSTAVGDSVNILPGGRTPIILRSVGPNTPAYKVIGDCSLDLFISEYQRTWLPEFWSGWLPEHIMRELNRPWYSRKTVSPIRVGAVTEETQTWRRKRIYLF